ncbi:MAG: hypothetical protein KJO02_05570 [Erythrobacter sp.]|nr:hypothetical protein [Erythrobacter sp.]NNC48331.1 hypothetical protein [Sphingomonas sp.]
MSDTARNVMIDSQLRPVGVGDRELIAAFRAVDREAFLPEGLKVLAYRDRAIPTNEGALLAPAALGLLMQALQLGAGQSLLIIGPGADYAKALAIELGVDAVTVTGDKLTKGKAKDAPFDAILILGAIDELPKTIVDQLADGGIIASGVADQGVTRLAVARKVGGCVALDPFTDVQVPVLDQFSRKPAFTF